MSYKQFVTWMISVVVIIISASHFQLVQHERHPHKGALSMALFQSVIADRDRQIAENKADIRYLEKNLTDIHEQLTTILTKIENAKTKTP